MADRNRTQEETRRRPPATPEAAGGERSGGGAEAPGGAVVGELGRLRDRAGEGDIAGGAALGPRSDVERMASALADDVDHNDEAD